MREVGKKGEKVDVLLWLFTWPNGLFLTQRAVEMRYLGRVDECAIDIEPYDFPAPGQKPILYAIQHRSYPQLNSDVVVCSALALDLLQSCTHDIPQPTWPEDTLQQYLSTRLFQ